MPDDRHRSALARFGTDLALGAARGLAGFGALTLGVVAAVSVRDGSPAGLFLLGPAVGLGALAVYVHRRRRTPDRR